MIPYLTFTDPRDPDSVIRCNVMDIEAANDPLFIFLLETPNDEPIIAVQIADEVDPAPKDDLPFYVQRYWDTDYGWPLSLRDLEDVLLMDMDGNYIRYSENSFRRDEE